MYLYCKKCKDSYNTDNLGSNGHECKLLAGGGQVMQTSQAFADTMDKFEELIIRLINSKRKPYGDEYDSAYLYPMFKIPYIDFCLIDHGLHKFSISISDLIFGNSGFMDFLERKQQDNETNYILVDGMPLYSDCKEYHLIKLSLMSTIVEKIIYILNNIKDDTNGNSSSKPRQSKNKTSNRSSTKSKPVGRPRN